MKRSLLILSCWFLAPAAFAILDTNNNGVSDFWERDFNNGNLFDVSFDPQGDADGDGWTNAQEAEADTNPFHPNPPDGMIRPVTAHIPQVWSEPSEFEQSYLISPEAVTVTWPTIAGKLYTLQFSSTLMQGSWLPVGDAFVAYGGETTYGFEVSLADKCFWRVSVVDIDEDSDGLTNHEEFLAGTDSTIPDTDGDTLSDHAELIAGTDPVQADADGDGWTDPQELAAGTDSRNQDTDGDGIPDPIDTEALVSAFAFADADGDGIADGNDPQPTTARGPAPSVASETAFGNPLSNLIKDETVKFVLTVSNPAGPAPTASNLTFFLNGTEEPATITAIGTPIGSSQRFLLTWAAKTTANYPTLTLQNLTLRFRDSQQATSWLKLARIDVAEWEGKMITLPFVSSEESWGYEVMTHQNGLKKKATLVSRNNAGNMVYRGPKTMKVTNANGETSDLQLPDVAIPFLKIAGSPGTPPNVVEQQDYATLATDMDVDFDFNNGSAKSLQFQLSQAGISTTLSPGQSHFDNVSLANAVLPLGTSALISYLDGTDWRLFYSTYWPVANTAGANSRILRSVNVLTTAAGQLKVHAVHNFMDRDVKITPHASGTLDYPGLPQESVTSEYDKKYMPISSEEWRKVVIKIYPPQQHFTYSKGYRVTIGTGTTGDAAPQTGWMAQTQSGGTLTALTIPTDGKIEILATDTNLYPQLTSPEGLVLFLKRDAAVDQVHILSVDILPIVETNSPVRLGALNILPVDIAVDADRNGLVQFGVDQISPPEHYQFWVNNDQDKGNDDKADDISPDSTDYLFPNHDDDIVNDLRDLEDFARIQIKVPGSFVPDLKSGKIKMALKFNPQSVVANPIINIRLHLDADGGRDYIEDEASALKHVGQPEQHIYNAQLGSIGEGEQYEFPTTFWTGTISEDYPEATESQPERYLLFEGAGVGKGELVLEFHEGGKLLCEAGSCRIELRDIKQMYEEYAMADIHGKTWQQINELAPTEDTDEMTAGEKAVYQNYDLPEVFEYSEPDAGTPEYEKDYILFVHGWRMKPSEKYAFTETAFKRLWHRGYRGRFGTFSWPAEWTDRHSPLAVPDGILWDPRNYDRSDRKAYLSGTALNSLLHRLNTMYPGRVRMFAHSMGNVVASQALRIEVKKSNPQQIVHTYAACQAASAAFAYDAVHPRTMTHAYISTHPQVTAAIQAGATFSAPESSGIPDAYGHYPDDYPNETEYFSGLDEVVSGNIINVHNWSDSALAAWMVGQWQKPDFGWGYSDMVGDGIDTPVWWRQDGLSGRQALSLFHDTPEIFAHIAEAKSPALGASVEGDHSTQNAISLNLNTMVDFSENQQFEGTDEDHSAQFLSIIMRRREFWDRLLQDLDFFNIETGYPIIPSAQ